MAGFWKATGRDKAVYEKSKLMGMRKTLVFYKGRAPNGQKTDWIMHEYRLELDENAPPQVFYIFLDDIFEIDRIIVSVSELNISINELYILLAILKILKILRLIPSCI